MKMKEWKLIIPPSGGIYFFQIMKWKSFSGEAMCTEPDTKDGDIRSLIHQN